jgi:lipopolysaccharide/colanic/teichoic acid biosynthesis glycosyltransferase
MKYHYNNSMPLYVPDFEVAGLDWVRNGPLPTGPTPFKISVINRVFKRIFDFFLAILMIITFLPMLLILSAYILVVYRVSPIFRHTRVGKDGKHFDCYKFRTMVPDAEAFLAKILASDPARQREWDETHKLKDDPRVLPGIGFLLRKSSLDELPQVFNVLFGHMSMVGPRPVTQAEVYNYGDYLQHYLSVRPGITGAWQIGGRSDTSYTDRVSIDAWYVENCTIRLDCYIFLKTVFSFCSGRLSGGV